MTFHILINLFCLDILTHLLLAQPCANNWFGKSCHLQCHCQTGHCIMGTCAKGCDNGWFGPQCQYQNLIYFDGSLVTSDGNKSLSELTDDDRDTCLSVLSNQDVVINFKLPCRFTFLRMNFKTAYEIGSVKVVFTSLKTTTLTCAEGEPTLVKDPDTVDVYCSPGEAVKTLTVTLSGNMTLCSVYVSGGRNVALQQNVSQSGSAAQSSGQEAVDGATESCVTTDASDANSWLNVTLADPRAVNRIVLHSPGNLEYVLIIIAKLKAVVYNTEIRGRRRALDGHIKDIKLFTLILSDADGHEIHTTGDTSDHIFQEKMLWKVFSTIQVLKVSVRANLGQSDTKRSPLSLVCEVEVYGDCVSGTRGLDCEANCPWDCLSICSPVDGSCINSELSQDSQSSCPDSCYNNSCTDDLCTQGCYGYTDPPHCTQKCSDGKHGKECSGNCSHCTEESCHFQTGDCLFGCLGYSDFPTCKIKCPLTLYGVNCSDICSHNCYNLKCHFITGLCDSGCDGFSDPPLCETPCIKGHGYNCMCHEYCKECSDSSHLCNECKLGFKFDDRHIQCREGEQPQLAMDLMHNEIGGLLYIVPVLFIFLSLGLTVSGVYFYLSRSPRNRVRVFNQAHGPNYLKRAHGVRSAKQAEEARCKSLPHGAGSSGQINGDVSTFQDQGTINADQTQGPDLFNEAQEAPSTNQDSLNGYYGYEL